MKNLFNKYNRTIKNNGKKINDLENRIKVLSDSLENESEAVEIYKNEYEKLLKKYQETEYKLDNSINLFKIFKLVLEQNKKYTDEECSFRSVSDYSKYLLAMVQYILDYTCPEEKEEKKPDLFEDKYFVEKNEHDCYVDKMKWITESLRNTAYLMRSGATISYQHIETYAEVLEDFLKRENNEKEKSEQEICEDKMKWIKDSLHGVVVLLQSGANFDMECVKSYIDELEEFVKKEHKEKKEEE